MILSGKKEKQFDLQLVMKKLSLMLKYQKVYTKMLLTIFFNCQLWGEGTEKSRPHFKAFWKEMVC